MERSMRVAQKIYRTTNNADLQSKLDVKATEESPSVSKDVASTLIGKLGLC